ncbi:MAG: flagellar FliJ family protein [Opitutaceae bacterium]|nr:flagellar FliJ family protein [Opitutaceae bacterium]
MKRFQFPLKSVVVVREAREARARDAFIAAVRAVMLAESEVGRIVAEKTAIEKMLLAERQPAFHAAEQVAFIRSHQRLVTREGEARAAVCTAQQVREQRRQDWMETRRDVRLIEKLRTSALGVYRRESEREAQRLLDDHTNAAVARESGALARNQVCPT